MCNAFGHIAGFGMNFTGALWETINDNEAPFLAGPFNFFGRLAGKESKRIAEDFIKKNLKEIPDVITNVIESAPLENQVNFVRDQVKSDWTIWTNVGYLSDVDFKASNSTFRQCFKSGHYVAAMRPDKNKDGQEFWMFSQDLNLEGTRDLAPVHYSLRYIRGAKTTAEHITYSRGQNIHFSDNTLQEVRADLTVLSQTNPLLKDYLP